MPNFALFSSLTSPCRPTVLVRQHQAEVIGDLLEGAVIKTADAVSAFRERVIQVGANHAVAEQLLIGSYGYERSTGLKVLNELQQSGFDVTWYSRSFNSADHLRAKCVYTGEGYNPLSCKAFQGSFFYETPATFFPRRSCFSRANSIYIRMELAPEHAQRIKNSLPPKVAASAAAFAYARVTWVAPHALFVEEIRSEILPYLPLELQILYRDFSPVLSRLLEAYVCRQTPQRFQSERSRKNLVLIYPDRETYVRRWQVAGREREEEKLCHGIPDLLDSYYEVRTLQQVAKLCRLKDLKTLGLDGLPDYLGKTFHVLEFKNKLSAASGIFGGISFTFHDFGKQSLGDEASLQYLSRLRNNRNLTRDLFLPMSFCRDLETIIDRPLPEKVALATSYVSLIPFNVGANELSFSRYLDINPYRGYCEDKIRGTPIEDFIHPNIGIISKGSAGGASENWSELPKLGEPNSWKIELIHLRKQNRHPSLRFIHFDEAGKLDKIVCILIKGGGLGHFDGEKVWLPEDFPQGTRLPLYEEVPSVDRIHGLWGGASGSESHTEQICQIALGSFIAQCDPKLLDLVPSSLFSGYMRGVPVWHTNKTERISFEDYAQRYLSKEKSGEYPGLSVTCDACDVRISTLIQQVFWPGEKGKYSRKDRKQEIDSALTFFYFVNRESFKIPPENLEGKIIGPAQVLRYLHHASRFNHEAACRIYSRICDRSIAALGIIHGGAGHLGGGSYTRDENRYFGSLRGGACAIRNRTLTGSFCDVASLISYPWSSLESYRALPTSDWDLQRLDVVFWEETRYWVEKILFGQMVSTAETGEFYVDNRNPIVLFKDDPLAIQTAKRLTDGQSYSFQPYDSLCYARHQEIYRNYLMIGNHTLRYLYQ